MSEETWFTNERIRYIINIGLFVLAILPLVFPFNLPLKIGRTTEMYYNTVEELNPDELVIFYFAEGTAQWGEMGPPGIAQLQQLVNKGVNIIVVCGTIESPGLFDANLKPAIDWKDYVYGEDWLNIGYYPGGESFITSLATEPHSAFVVDADGTSLDSLPLWADYQTGEDVVLIIGNEPSSGITFMRQFQVKWNTPLVWAAPSAVYTSSLSYLESDQLKGLLNSLRGGAELEKLINKPGRGLSAMDALSAIHVWVILLTIAGNIQYLRGRMSK